MRMPTPTSQLLKKLYPYLQKAETVFVILLLISVFLANSGRNSLMLVILSLSGLSVIFFLNAFIEPPTAQFAGSHRYGKLLQIVPRAIWISCAAVLMGIIFDLLGFMGGVNLLAIGGGGILTGIIILAILYSRGVRSIGALTPILYRAVPAMLASGYLLFG